MAKMSPLLPLWICLTAAVCAAAQTSTNPSPTTYSSSSAVNESTTETKSSTTDKPTITATTTTTTPTTMKTTTTTPAPISLDQVCSTSDTCEDENAQYKKVNGTLEPKCLCKLEWFENGTSCEKYRNDTFSLTIDDTAETNISLTWERIQSHYTTQRYFLQWTAVNYESSSDSKGPVEVLTKSGTHVLDHLVPGVKYSILLYVEICEENECFKLSYKAADQRTNVSQIGQYEILSYDERGHDIFGYIRFDLPVGKYDNCTAKLEDGSNSQDHTFNCSLLELPLDLGVNYTLEVRTHSGLLTSSVRKFNLGIPMPEPGAVEDLQVSPSGRQANVTWKPPKSLSKYVNSYDVILISKDIGVCVGKYSVKLTKQGQLQVQSTNVMESCEDSLRIEVDNTSLIVYSLRIQDLKPYSNYTVKILARNQEGFGEQRNTTFRTNIVVPRKPQDPKATAINSTTIEISWKAPNEYPGPTYYEVNAFVKGTVADTKAVNVSGFNSTKCQVSGLHPFTNYSVTIVAFTDKGHNTSEEASVWTKESASEAVENPKVTNQSSRSLTLEWDKPDHVNGNLKGYVIFVEPKPPNDENGCQVLLIVRGEGEPTFQNPKKECTFEQVSTQTFAKHQAQNISGLSPFTSYNVTVVVYNGVGPGEPTSLQVKTNASESEPVKNLTVTNQSSTSFRIQWNMPDHVNGELKAYVISVKQAWSNEYENDCQVIKISHGNYTDLKMISDEENCKVTKRPVELRKLQHQEQLISGLSPFTSFNVTVTAYNDVGLGTPYSIQVKTSPSAPESVQNLRVTNESSTSFKLEWTRPTHINGNLKSYIISVSVRQTTSNEGDNVCQKIVISDKESEDISSVGPSIKIVEKSGLSEPSSGLISTSNESIDNCASIHVPTEALENYGAYDISGLSPFTNYTVTIVASNDVGHGKVKSISVKTSPSESEPVQNLHVIDTSNSSFELEWKEPKHINGILKAYVIITKQTKNVDDGRENICNVLILIKDKASINIKEYEFCDQDEKITYLDSTQPKVVSGLYPFTNYTVTVVVLNNAGKGQLSVISVLTNSSESEQVQNLHVVDTSNSSFELQWRKPKHINGIFKAYVIIAKRTKNVDDGRNNTCKVLILTNDKASINIEENEFCDQDEEIRYLDPTQPKVVSGLYPFTNYTVTVVVLTNAGKGQLSVISVLTNSSESEQVQNLHVIDTSDSSFELEWKEPKHINGILKTYVIIAKRTKNVDDGRNNTCKVLILTKDKASVNMEENKFCDQVGEIRYLDPNQPKLVSGLYPFTNYTVTVVAFNNAGKGQLSVISVLTNSSESEQVQNLHVIDTSNSSFELQWSEPKHINGILKAYVVIAKRTKNVDDGRNNTCRGIILTKDKASVDIEENEFCDPVGEIRYLGPNQPKLVSGLYPFTNYTVTVVAFNNAGKGQLSVISVLTNSSESEKVQDLFIRNLKATSFTVQWKPPVHINGILKGYKVYIRPAEHSVNKCGVIIVQPENSEFLWDEFEEQTCASLKTEDLSAPVQNELSIEVDKLLPYTIYKIKVVVYNDFGRGKISEAPQTRTQIAVPSIPSQLQCQSQNPELLLITWRPPEVNPGPTSYVVTISESKHPVNSSSGWDKIKTNNVIGYSNSSTLFDKVRPHWFYLVQMKAQTEKGNSDTVTTTNPCLTLSTAPGKPVEFDIQPVNDSANQITVTWLCPSEKNRHGEIEEFRLIQTPTDSKREDILLADLKPNTYNIIARNGQEKCTNLYSRAVTAIPEIVFNFKIQAKVKDVQEYGEEDIRTYTGFPKVPSDFSTLSELPVRHTNIQSNKKETTSFDLYICVKCLQDNSNGQVMSFGVIICAEKFCNEGDLPKYGASQITLSTWGTAKAQNFHKPYVVTKQAFKDSISKNNSEDGDVLFHVGIDKTCGTQPNTVYCNGPLPSDTSFRVLAYSCTRGGCSVSKSVGPFITAAESDSLPIPMIVGAIAGIMCAALIIIAVFFVRRKYFRPKRKDTRQHSKDHQEELELNATLSEVERPIKVLEFAQKLDELGKYDNALAYEEFEEMTRQSPVHPTEVGLELQNKSENRWTNIIPFDHSRVKLNPDINIPDASDYINANYIPGLYSPHEYIATQGPLSRTVSKFWTMVWQQKVSVIVMLSDFQEPDPRTFIMREKVARYYLDEEESNECKCGETLVVRRTGKVDNAVWEIRTLQLTNMAERKRRFVKHFFFKKWTDHAADISPANLLEFVNVVREETKQKPQAPLLVHCSAGVGRTGTFLAADYFTNFFNSLPEGMGESEFLQSNVDVFGRVLKMRNYRRIMVQTKVQYFFIYQVVHELIKRKMMTYETEDAHCQNAETEEEKENEPVYANINVSMEGLMQQQSDAEEEENEEVEEYKFAHGSPGQHSEDHIQTHQF